MLGILTNPRECVCVRCLNGCGESDNIEDQFFMEEGSFKSFFVQEFPFSLFLTQILESKSTLPIF